MSNECPRCGSEYTHLNRRLGLRECEDCGHRFEEGAFAAAELTMADLDRPATRPLRVFLSYPHSSREICVKIRDTLRARGHDVWFDESHIRVGNDWRARIAEGIDSHRTFVSCLTHDAVRESNGERGVCLDEISIAVSTPGCVLQPVLLEPADVVRPTAAVAHRQWLDMSAWREAKARGEDVFCAWFSERMLRLLEVVESDETRAFAGEVEEVYKLLPLARWGTGREDLLARPLEGRAWLAAELAVWMDHPQGGTLCALWGDPGVGKSAFSVHYAMASDRVAAAVCLSHGDVRFGTMSALAQSVAYQLACRLPDYRGELLRALRGTPVSQVGPFEVADLLFVKPLAFRHVDGGHEGVCVLVDGLDECSVAERDAAVTLLQRLRDGAPRWLRLIVVARPEPDLLSALRPDHELWLRGEDSENMADVAAYLDGRLGEIVDDAEERQGLVQAIAERSQGVFLFAEAVTESARLGGFDSSDLTSLPSTLGEALRGWLARAFPDDSEYERRFRPLVGAMLASPTPLPETELARLLGASDSDVGDLRLRAGTLLERGEDDFGEPTLSVAHRYVAEWMASDRSGRFRTYPREALRTMALACHRIATDNPDSLTGYEAASAVALCEAAELGEQAHELRRSSGLAARLSERGNWLHTWGKVALAGALHGQALEICELLASELGTPEARRELSVSLDNTGDLAHSRGDLAAANDDYRRSLGIRGTLVAELGTAEARVDFADSLINVGRLAFEQNDLSTAWNALTRARSIREAIVLELGTLEAKHDLSELLLMIGDFALSRSDMATAGDAYNHALEIAEELTEELGTHGAKSVFATSLDRAGSAFFKYGDFDAARDAFERSLVIAEELAAELNTPRNRHNLSAALGSVGDAAFELGDFEAAQDAYERSLEIAEELAAELGTLATRRFLSLSLGRIGSFALERGDFDAAGEALARSLRIREAIVSEYGTPSDKRSLSSVLHDVGFLALERGHLAAAGDVFTRTLGICEELAAEMDTPDYKRNLAWSYFNLGLLGQRQGDVKQAHYYFTCAHTILVELDRELHTLLTKLDLEIVSENIAELS